ncbi:transposase [Pseudomonas sp. H11T01]|uniref:transposase n=1 Tax=Pseudomonas sp. H11T01 TaxID=3402749 RepID=UPI003ACD0920
MRQLKAFLVFCLTTIQVACVQTSADLNVVPTGQTSDVLAINSSTTDMKQTNPASASREIPLTGAKPVSLDDDAIPTNAALPLAGVNQRPVVGIKTALLVAARWRGDRELDMQSLYASSFSEQPRSLSDYLLKASGGRLILKGTTIKAEFAEPAPSGGFYDEIREAQKAARAQGIEPNDYDYFFVVHNNGVGGAQGQMPGNKIVLRDQPYAGHYLWAHEFGHNLGFSHESTFGGLFDTYINCPLRGSEVSALTGCGTKRYGDTGDPVQGSNGIQSLYPANNRWYAGWLDQSQAAVVNSTGLYGLGVLGGAGPQLYLINRGANAAPQQIALELRQPSPPYDNFAATDNRVTGVWARYTTMGGRVDNVQLDGTPETATTTDPTLQPGRILKDEAARISVKVCKANNLGSVVAVAVNGETLPECSSVPAKPRILTPQDGDVTDRTLVISGTSRPGALVAGFIHNTQDAELLNTYADAWGDWSVKTKMLPSGKYEVKVKQGMVTGSPFEIINIELR